MITNLAHVAEAAIIDITNRKRVEEALRESGERYRTIVETALEGIWVLDSSGNTSFFNHWMAAMLGDIMEEMNGRRLLEFMDETNRPDAKRRFEESKWGVIAQEDFHFRRRTDVISGRLCLAILCSMHRVWLLLRCAWWRTSPCRKLMEHTIRERAEKIKLFA
jgi:PAS domain S-box-containing protein